MGNKSEVSQRDFYVFIDRKNRPVEAEGVPVQIGIIPEDLITQLRESIGGVEGLVFTSETPSGENTVTYGYSLQRNPVIARVLVYKTDFSFSKAYPCGASHIGLSFGLALDSDLIERLEAIAIKHGLQKHPKI